MAEQGKGNNDSLEPVVTTNDTNVPFRDEEKSSQQHEQTSASEVDPDLVTWDGEDDPMNPKNWPKWRKWAVALLSSLGGLVTLMSGAMLAPALGAIGRDLHIGDAEAQLALSIFVLAFAFAPLLLAPCSEVFGRRWVWIIAGLWYILWNTVCGFVQTLALLIVGRFFAGVGGSATFAMSVPILGDCWKSEERGKAFALATFIPLLGPAVGPIIGGFVTQAVSWRWLFWVLSIFHTILMVLFFFLFRETHHPTILGKKAEELRKRTGRNYHTQYELSSPTLSQRLKLGLVRPYRLIISQPIIQVISLFLAYNFGILYLVLSTFASLWTDRYHESVSISGLHYIAQVLGYTLAAQVGGPTTDRIWRRLQNKHDGATAPEYRVPLMVPGALLIPTGLFWYGWSAEAKAPWIVVDIGIGIFGCGIILGTQAMQTYVLEAFPEHTASATAASQLLRNVFAFAFPIFAPKMYSTLGYGWSNSVLAFVFLAIGVPAPLILWRYGALLRMKGKQTI
ncbi:MAG: hypothetical protein M1821_004448 [Bathelium mastoideum]|nr:MAG: hypothetical protein M1821_004448 [Bathelium mastoideum]